MNRHNAIVSALGKEALEWITTHFCKSTTLMDVPEKLLRRLACVDITIRDYQRDSDSIAAIALLTFAYKMGGKTQIPHHGPRDILLLKVLCKGELERREKGTGNMNPFWLSPVYELITGEVGERIRKASILKGGHKRGESHGD